MFYTRGQLVTELGNRLKTGSTSAAIAQRLAYWLECGQQEVAHEVQPKHLVKTYTFSTVANQQRYHVPFAFNSIKSLMDTTQDLEMIEKQEADIEAIDPNFSDGGSAIFYWVSDHYNVRAQPTSASVVRLVASAADTNVVLIIGTNNATGEVEYEALTLNGATPVNSTITYSDIQSISMSASYNRATTITATSNALAVTNAIIKPGMNTDDSQTIFLWPKPSGVSSMRVRGIKKPRIMATDNHPPNFPEEFHELILLSALKRGHRDLMRYALAKEVEEMEYLPALARLKKKDDSRASKFSPVINGPVPVLRGGRLPGNFPG